MVTAAIGDVNGEQRAGDVVEVDRHAGQAGRTRILQAVTVGIVEDRIAHAATVVEAEVGVLECLTRTHSRIDAGRCCGVGEIGR